MALLMHSYCCGLKESSHLFSFRDADAHVPSSVVVRWMCTRRANFVMVLIYDDDYHLCSRTDAGVVVN